MESPRCFGCLRSVSEIGKKAVIRWSIVISSISAGEPLLVHNLHTTSALRTQ